ncbi:unnamed protein product [Orchesella dallaii]|uniref:Pickpocket protein 28 n=1 Tax=Orchesella dallaii TaxID=48710 RepID=A0ABP1PPZ7_9HEXA
MAEDKDEESFECCPHNRRLEGFLGQVVRESNLHGVKYLATPNLHITERIYWITAVLVCFGYSIYLVSGVVQKYFENPVIISFQPQETNIGQIPFPAITICNVNLMDGPSIWGVYNDVLKTLEQAKARNVTEDELNSMSDLKSGILFLDHVTHICLSAKSFRRHMNESLFDAQGNPDVVTSTDKQLQEIKDNLFNILYQTEGVNNMNSAFFKNVWVKGKVTFLRQSKIISIMVYEAFEFVQMAPSCEDMILKCMWARKPLNCTDIFFEIRTRHGSCCVFNMMPKYILRNMPENDKQAEREKRRLPKAAIDEWKEFDLSKMVLQEHETSDRNYPRHQKAGGKPYGLSIMINPQLGMYSTCNTNDGWGFKMVAHSPISYPDIMYFGKAIPPNSEVFAHIEPQLTLGNDDLYSVNINKRGCYLAKDKEAELPNYKYYSSDNCMEECIAQLTYRNCSCVRYFMPRNDTQKLCEAKKRPCAEKVKNNAAGKSGACSHCWPSCTEIKYKVQMSQFPLRRNESNILYYNTSTELNKVAHNYSIIHIYLGADSLYAKERKSLFDLSSLIGNAGGLLGLTLGFSVISLVELIYFFTLRAWFQYQSSKKDDEDSQNDERNVTEQEKVCRKLATSHHHLSSTTSSNEYYSWAVRNRFGVQNSDKIAVIPTVEQSEKHLPNFQILTSQIKYPY